MRGERGLAIGRLHQRDEPADQERDHGVEERNAEARGEHRRVPALGLTDEVPMKPGSACGGAPALGVEVARILKRAFFKGASSGAELHREMILGAPAARRPAHHTRVVTRNHLCANDNG